MHNWNDGILVIKLSWRQCMDPYGIIRPLYRIGPFSFPSYFIFLSLGFILATLIGLRRSKKYSIDPVSVIDLSMLMFITGLFGARLFHIIFEKPELYLATPLEFIRFWKGGFVWYGGLIIGVISAIIFIKKRKLQLGKVADLASIPVAIGLAIGRLGCHFAGCCYGRITDSSIYVKYRIIDNVKPQVLVFNPEVENIPLVPTQLISTFAIFTIAFLLFIYEKRKKKDGDLFLFYVIAYSIFRFIIEFYRNDFRGTLFPILSTSQVIAIISFIIAIPILFYNWGLFNKIYKKNIS